MKIAVHIDAAECPFDGIDDAVLITVEFLKMVMGQIGCLRTGNA